MDTAAAPESHSPTSTTLPPLTTPRQQSSDFFLPLLHSARHSTTERQDVTDLDALDQASSQLQQVNSHLLEGVALDVGPGSVAASSLSFVAGWSRGVDEYVRSNERYDPQEQQNLILLPGGRAVVSPLPKGGFLPDKQWQASPTPGTADNPFTDTYHGRRIKPIARPGERVHEEVPTLEIITVKKRRAFLNKEGVLQFHEVEELAVEETAVPPRPPGFWTTSSWCKEIMTRQELKLVLPKSCSDFDEVPMMPCMSNKYVRNLKPIVRDRDKNWRQTSFRNVYVGRGTLARKKKKKTSKKDMFGSDAVKWVEGYPLRKKILHTEACLISDEYTICSIHGVGITGRIYNEAANPDIPRGLEMTAHTPEDCGMYQIKLEILELPDLFHDKMELLGPGKTKQLCSALVRMLYFEYSPSDPRKNVDEMPIFGGYGKHKYVRPPLPDSSSEDDEEEEEDSDGSDSESGSGSQSKSRVEGRRRRKIGGRDPSSSSSSSSSASSDTATTVANVALMGGATNANSNLDSGTSRTLSTAGSTESTRSKKKQKKSKKKKHKKNKKEQALALKLDGPLPEDGVVRGADGLDHILLPDRMKILCISRGFKLNRRERRENWLKKRNQLRTDGTLPSTPRPPKLPLRMVDRVYCGTAIRAGLYFYVSIYCYQERPNNYVVKFHHSISCTVLAYNIGKKKCGVLAMEPRPPNKWSAKIEHQVCHRVMQLFEVRTFQPPPPSDQPLQMAIWYNSVPGISQNAYRRTKEVRKKSGRRTRVPKLVFGRKHQRENGLLCKRSRKHTQAQKKGKQKGKLKKGYFSSWVLKRPEWENKKGLRIAMGTMKWEGHRIMYEVYMPKKEGNFFELHMFEPCTNSQSFVIEFDMYDMRSFLKGTHALANFEKRRKKFIKKYRKMLMGHNEKNDDVIPAFQLFLGERITLLQEGKKPRAIVEVVNGPHLHSEKKSAMDAKKEIARKRKEAREAMYAIEEVLNNTEEGGAAIATAAVATEATVATEAAPVAEDGKPPLPLLIGGIKVVKDVVEEVEEDTTINFINDEDTRLTIDIERKEEDKLESEQEQKSEQDVAEENKKVEDAVDYDSDDSNVSDVDDFEDNQFRSPLQFHGQYLSINRIIYQRWHGIEDQREKSKFNYSSSSSGGSSGSGSNRSSGSLSNRSSPGRESPLANEELKEDANMLDALKGALSSAVDTGGQDKTDVVQESPTKDSQVAVDDGEAKEGKEGKEEKEGKEGGASSEEEVLSGDEESVDLAASDQSEEDSFEASSLFSGSDDEEEEPVSVYILVTVRQRGWRLYFDCYEPLECQTYRPSVPEATSRSLTAEFTKLDIKNRDVILGVNASGLLMKDGKKDRDGNIPTVIAFATEEEDGSDSEGSSIY